MYKRQVKLPSKQGGGTLRLCAELSYDPYFVPVFKSLIGACLLYTSDAADERSSVDLGGRRIIKYIT